MHTYFVRKKDGTSSLIIRMQHSSSRIHVSTRKLQALEAYVSLQALTSACTRTYCCSSTTSFSAGECCGALKLFGRFSQLAQNE